ncbi:MAG TPA: hypothetical protein VFH71_04405 [Rhodanobacteraceae bacterium]|nr:hypothetical protein [Rhodanobacteraceae bacterium]
MTVLATGAEALRRVHQFIQTMPESAPAPLRVGNIVYPMVTGTVYQPDKMIVLGGADIVVYLWIDQNRWELIELSGPQFVRVLDLDAASRGAAQAAWLIPVARLEMVFLVGVLTGPSEIIAANLVEITMWAGGHQAEVHEGVALLGKILPELRELRARCPTLWKEMMRTTNHALIQAFISQIGSNFTSATNIANFLGGLLGSWSKAADDVVSAGFRGFVEHLTGVLKSTTTSLYQGAQINVVEMGVWPSQISRGMKETIQKELRRYPGRERGLQELCSNLAKLAAILQQMNDEVSAAEGGGKISFKPQHPSSAPHSALLRMRKALFGP